MKNFILIFAVMFSSVVYSAINVEPDTGNIIESTPDYSVSVGNILDMYSLNAVMTNNVNKALDCQAAKGTAGLSAKPLTSGEGVYVGMGTGFTGSCGALAASFGLVTEYDLSFSSDLVVTENNVLGEQLSVGFGVHYKF